MSTRSATANSAVLLQSYLNRLLAELPEIRAPVAPTRPRAEPAAPRRAIETPGAATPEVATPAADERPAWQATPFQAMVFDVSEVRFAAPLIHLHGVVPFSDAPSAIPDTPEWLLGMCAYRDQNVRVVDTAGLVLQGQNLDVERRFQHVILLQAGRWGLTCDAVSEVLTVDPEAVQWRGRRDRTPWLAGTLREKLCAVLDVDTLAATLERDAFCAG